MLSRVIATLTAKERARLAGVLLLWLAAGGLEIAGLGLLFTFVAALDGRTPRWAALIPLREGTPAWVLALGGALLLFYLTKTVLGASAELAMMRLCAGAHTRLGKRLFATYLELDYDEHLERSREVLRRNLVGHTSSTFGEYVPAAVRLFADGLLLLALVVVLAWASVGLTLALIGIFGSIATLYLWLTRRPLSQVSTLRQERLTDLNRWVSQALSGIKEVRLLGRQQVFLSRHHRALAELLALQRRLRTLELVPRGINELAVVLGLVIAGFYVAYEGIALAHAAPTLTLFAVAGLRGSSAMSRVLGAGNILRLSAPHVDELLYELESMPARDVATASVPLVLREHLRLEGVHFAYRERLHEGQKGSPYLPACLTNVSFDIPRGSFVAFVGPSGGGKSTLVHLICGLLRPRQGRITVDAIAIDTNLPGWQAQIAYIPQSPYMAADTVRRNVAFGIVDEQIDEERVRWALAEAQVWPAISRLPHGIDTHMREEAAAFSGGERQRVAIARALYADRPVLIVDEATSHLDQVTEQAIADVLGKLAGEKTVIAVAHHLSTVSRADKLFFIEEGHLLADGSFGTLLDSCPAFARLVKEGDLP